MASKYITKQRIIAVLFLFVLIVFRAKFEKIITELIVNPFLSECASDWGSNIIFAIVGLSIVMAYCYRYKRDYHSSLDSVLLVVVVSAIYSYYRFATDTWDFVGLRQLPILKYSDLVYVWLAGEIAVKLKNLIKKKPEKQANPLSFVLDEPIESLEEDELDRKHEAKLLADRVRQTHGKYSFSVAVNGAWGSGKTSFMKLVKEYLKGDDVIIMDFNPWLGQDSNLITKDFFESLRSTLKPYSSQIDGELESYANQFVEVEDGWISKSFKSLFSLVGSKSLKERFDNVNSTLEELDKQVVVFIDDLDRLHDSEIQSVLRLIRNTADFRKVKYVVAFDRAYVEKAIEALNVTNHTSYLDKIFLYSLPLPPIRSSYILDELEVELINRFPSQVEEIQKALKTAYKPVKEVDKFILTVRDFRRFVNQFVADYESLVDEVFFPEFLRIQLLKFKFYPVYELLQRKRDVFLEVPSNKMHWIDDKRGLELKRTSGSSHGKDYVLNQYLIDNSPQLSIAQSDILLIMELAESVFEGNRYSSGQPGEHLSIIYGFNFERYFRNRIFEYNLSDKEFTHTLKLSLGEIQKQIVQWVNDGKQMSVVRRFTDVDFLKCENREEFEKHVYSILFLAKYKDPKSSGFQISYYDRDLISKLSDYEGGTSKRFYNSDAEAYKDFVRGLFSTAEIPFTFESIFLSSVVRQYYDHFVLPLEELQTQCVKYLSTYLLSVKTLDRTCWELYHRCDISERVNTGSNTFQIRKSKHPKANTAFIDFIQEHAIDQFLYATVDVEMRDQKTFAVASIIVDMFGSFNAFEEFLAKQDAESHKYMEEFREFLKAFMENGAGNYIPFEFKVIPIHEKINER